MSDPGPSWAVFDACTTCRAKVGEPCRFGSRSYKRGQPLRNPHPGRRQIGPNGGRRPGT